MLTVLWARFSGYILAVAAALAAVLGLYFRGKAAGKEEARVERDLAIKEQADAARQEVRNVQDEVAGMDDSDVDRYLTDEWVRDKPAKGRR